MRFIALSLSFVAMFGATWLMCMRASDWNTDRWNRDSRWIPLVFGGMAWLVIFSWLTREAYPGNARRSTEMVVAFIAGAPIAVLAYATVARVRPGAVGARPMAPGPSVAVPWKQPRSFGGWLLLDLRTIPRLWRQRKFPRK